MIQRMLMECRPYLPLKISTVNWDETLLHIYGLDWSFTTLSAWRITEENRMVLGCFDKNSVEKALQLVDLEIIDIKCQENRLKIDPIFKLSNNQFLEIFSTDTYEPWTFNLDPVGFFNATPSAPNLFIK